jgi:hypothetical protein
MATIRLPCDFKEFLRLLHSRGIRYLVVDGYAVAYPGHPRITGDLEIRIGIDAANASAITDALKALGFDDPASEPGLLLHPGQVIRMGNPPVRIELITSATGVDFETCYRRRLETTVDDGTVQYDQRRRRVREQASSGPPAIADLHPVHPPPTI